MSKYIDLSKIRLIAFLSSLTLLLIPLLVIITPIYDGVSAISWFAIILMMPLWLPFLIPSLVLLVVGNTIKTRSKVCYLISAGLSLLGLIVVISWIFTGVGVFTS